MTDPKTRETPGTASSTASRSKAVATTSTHDEQLLPDNQNPMLEQLVALTQSISELVKQAAGTGTQQPPGTTPPGTTTPGTTTPAAEDAGQRTRVAFAYDFLGVVLGRRAPSVFQLATVGVTRATGTLTFTRLNGATVARIRAVNNTVRVLENLQDGQAVHIDNGAKPIADTLRIDSIVVFKSVEGVLAPVALGPCLAPVPGAIIL